MHPYDSAYGPSNDSQFLPTQSHHIHPHANVAPTTPYPVPINQSHSNFFDASSRPTALASPSLTSSSSSNFRSNQMFNRQQAQQPQTQFDHVQNISDSSSSDLLGTKRKRKLAAAASNYGENASFAAASNGVLYSPQADQTSPNSSSSSASLSSLSSVSSPKFGILDAFRKETKEKIVLHNLELKTKMTELERTQISAILEAYKQAIRLVKAQGIPKSSEDINATINLTELGVRRLIFYFKLINDFRNLDHDLMVKLLKKNMMNLIQIQVQFLFEFN
jgi:hypothetical protein